MEQNDFEMDFAKCEQHETESQCGKIKSKISEPQDILVIANVLLGYYYQLFNAILQVNAIVDLEILSWCPVGPVLLHGEKVPL